MRKETAIFTIVCFALMAATAYSLHDPQKENAISTPTVELTRQGSTDWQIYLPPQAGTVERFAAHELKTYITRISGAEVKDTSTPKSQHTIYVGLRKDIEPRISSLPAAKPGFDGYSIQADEQQLVIAGDNPRGVLYGVYEILERLGCRWYQPNLDKKDPESIPQSTDVSLAEGSWSQASPIEQRFYNGSAFFFEVIPERVLPQIEWAARNRYNGLSWQPHHGPGKVEEELELLKACGAFDEMEKRGLMFHGPFHSFPFFLPTERYFKDHPEWFGMLNGKRQPHGGQWPLVNYCWSNPQANEEFMRNVEQFAQRWPQLKLLNLEWIDGGGVCQCPACKERGGANLIIDLFNTLSERLEKSAPWVTLEMVLGYGPIETPSPAIKPNGKWQGIYAHWGRNHRTSYSDPDYFRRANMLLWISHFPRYQVCSYYGACSHTPFNGPPFLHALEGDTAFLVKHKARGMLVLHYPHQYWWNYAFTLGEAGRQAYYYPARSVNEALRDYALSYFGPQAGPVVAECLEMLGANENLETSYKASRGETNEGERNWLKDMQALVLRAKQLAEGEPVYAYRVSKLAAGLELLIELAPSREKLQAAEKTVEEWRAAKISKDDALKKIDEARSYIHQVKALSQKLEGAYPGVAGTEWLESWYLRRLYLEPLERLEKTLTGEKLPEPSAKPAHVAGPQ